MWVFSDFGLHMPAIIPANVLDKAETKDIRQAVENGWDIQVRGRIYSHLKHLCDTYMPEGTYSKIYRTPNMDYNVRFYTTREAYAQALVAMALDIDYAKFKPTAERYKWGKEYHKVLNSIWSRLLDLAPAGGFYGPKSKKNPRGYGSSRKSLAKRFQEPVGGFQDECESWNDPYAPGGVDDVPSWATKSIHDMTDDELDEMEKTFGYR